MSCNGEILALLLDGPMQAWGVSSRYNRRTTLPYPTRSGITGMLCAALGIERTDKLQLESLNILAMEILVIEKKHRLTRWSDYQTVGGGYDMDSERGFIPTRAEDGKPRGTVLTDREYLADATFGVLISGDRAMLRRCETALQNPKWGVWLGRKCCVPADVICQGTFGSREEAVKHLERRGSGSVIRLIREVGNFEEGTDTLMDMPLDFSISDLSQRNQPRRVWVGSPSELEVD